MKRAIREFLLSIFCPAEYHELIVARAKRRAAKRLDRLRARGAVVLGEEAVPVEYHRSSLKWT